MKKLRILVFSATFGAGHVRAAEAVIRAIGLKQPYVDITHLDCGEQLSKLMNNIIKHAYIGMIKYFPKLWGKFYFGTGNISPDSLAQRFLNHMGRNEFERSITEHKPDLIICTYPTVAGVLSQLRLERRLNVPLVTVVTDFVTHSQWIHSGVDMYIVGCREVYDGLVARGIQPGRIRVTGIPVDYRFEQPLNKGKILTKLGLSQTRRTLLIMGGAYGVFTKLLDVCKLFANSHRPIQLIVVCGKDKKAYASLNKLVKTAGNPIVRFGYVSNVEELMTAADMIITKAGGLTVSEALTKRLPLVIFKPIPGQEDLNTYFLVKTGAGRAAKNLEDLESIVGSLLDMPEELAKMKEAAAAAIPGRSAEQAVEHMLYLLNDRSSAEKIG